jgi:uncharacterized membrane protein
MRTWYDKSKAISFTTYSKSQNNITHSLQKILTVYSYVGSYFMPVKISVETFIRTTVALGYDCVTSFYGKSPTTGTISKHTVTPT